MAYVENASFWQVVQLDTKDWMKKSCSRSVKKQVGSLCGILMHAPVVDTGGNMFRNGVCWTHVIFVLRCFRIWRVFFLFYTFVSF